MKKEFYEVLYQLKLDIVGEIRSKTGSIMTYSNTTINADFIWRKINEAIINIRHINPL